jgi:hypothetical protein
MTTHVVFAGSTIRMFNFTISMVTIGTTTNPILLSYVWTELEELRVEFK